MSSLTGVCIFCGQTATRMTGAPTPVHALAASVTQATSPASERFIPSRWPSFPLGEELKLPPCVVLPPSTESRAAAALRQLNDLPPASAFVCPNKILQYGYDLLTREPKEATNFLSELRSLIAAPKGIHEMIRSYIYAEPPFNQQTSLKEWCDYLELDAKNKEALIKTLDSLKKNRQKRAQEDRRLVAILLRNVLEKVYIKITRIRNCLSEKSPDERVRLEKTLKKIIGDIIDTLVSNNRNPMEKIVRILCEIEEMSELHINPEIPFFEPLAAIGLIGYILSKMTDLPAKLNINKVFEALELETSPDFLFKLQCEQTIEEFLENYDPVRFLQKFSNIQQLREAILEWAIKYYDLNQYKVVDGTREYSALTRAFCQNPQDLEAGGLIRETQLTREAILFLLEAAGIIRRK